MSNLIIVESPTKIKTIKRYLSDDYEVVASKGHVRDLPKSKLGVDIDNNFEPKYVEGGYLWHDGINRGKYVSVRVSGSPEGLSDYIEAIRISSAVVFSVIRLCRALPLIGMMAPLRTNSGMLAMSTGTSTVWPGAYSSRV